MHHYILIHLYLATLFCVLFSAIRGSSHGYSCHLYMPTCAVPQKFIPVVLLLVPWTWLWMWQIYSCCPSKNYLSVPHTWGTSLYSYPFISCYSVLCTIFHHWRFVSWVLLLPLHNYMCSPSKIYSSCAPLDTRYMVVDVAYLWLVSVLLVKRSFLVKFMCTCYSILLNTSFSLLMLECGCFIEEKFWANQI